MSQSGSFCISTEIPPVSRWCNSKVKFYLEVSASPSRCMFAVIVLSIRNAPSCVFIFYFLTCHLLSPGRGRGETEARGRRWICLLVCVILPAHVLGCYGVSVCMCDSVNSVIVYMFKYATLALIFSYSLCSLLNLMLPVCFIQSWIVKVLRINSPDILASLVRLYT